MRERSGVLELASVTLAALTLVAGCDSAAPTAPAAAAPADAVADHDLRLVGSNDLQARSAYQP